MATNGFYTMRPVIPQNRSDTGSRVTIKNIPAGITEVRPYPPFPSFALQLRLAGHSSGFCSPGIFFLLHPSKAFNSSMLLRLRVRDCIKSTFFAATLSLMHVALLYYLQAQLKANLSKHGDIRIHMYVPGTEYGPGWAWVSCEKHEDVEKMLAVAEESREQAAAALRENMKSNKETEKEEEEKAESDAAAETSADECKGPEGEMSDA
ncbi:hypothetical protein Esti_001437 [Eimeria stiedai]